MKHHSRMMADLAKPPKWRPEELPYCDDCHLQFGTPPEPHNVERLTKTKVVYTCDNCIEQAIQENWKYRP